MYAQAADYYNHLARGSSEQITVNSGRLKLAATPSTFKNPRSVSFLASATGGGSLTVQSWAFQAVTGGGVQSSPCTASQNPCVTTISQSGTMFVSALIGGKQELAQAQVTLDTCLTGDPVIDDPAVRLYVTSEWKSTLPEMSEMDHRELWGAIIEEPDGSRGLIQMPADSADNCNVYPPRVAHFTVDVGAHIVGFYHFHPQLPNVMARYCPRLGGVLPPNTYRYEAGPSTFDWNEATLLDAGLPASLRKPGMTAVPSYVFDGEHLYKYMPNVAPNNRSSSLITKPYHPANPNGCS
jgi:hypothetical protein